MKTMGLILLLLVIVILGLSARHQSTKIHKQKIKKWCEARDYQIFSIERRFFSTGPFVFTKNTDVLKVVTNEHIFWFRFSIFLNDIYIETPDGRYIKTK